MTFQAYILVEDPQQICKHLPSATSVGKGYQEDKAVWTIRRSGMATSVRVVREDPENKGGGGIWRDPKDKKPAGRRYREQASGQETAVIKAPGSKNHFMLQEQKDVARELKEKGGGCRAVRRASMCHGTKHVRALKIVKCLCLSLPASEP